MARCLEICRWRQIQYILFFVQESKDQKTYFLKIHAPWDVLATYAEVLKIKVPFKESDIPHGQDVPLEWLSHPLRLPEHIMRPQPDYFTYPFDKKKTDFFLISDKDTFFPPSTRSRIVSAAAWWFNICLIRHKKDLKKAFSNRCSISWRVAHITTRVGRTERRQE